MKLFSKKDWYTIDMEIDRCLNDMKIVSVDSKEYREAATSLKLLCEARGVKSPETVSMETVVTVGANLLGILLVLNFERTGAVISKAFGMIGRGSK